MGHIDLVDSDNLMNSTWRLWESSLNDLDIHSVEKFNSLYRVHDIINIWVSLTENFITNDFMTFRSKRAINHSESNFVNYVYSSPEKGSYTARAVSVNQKENGWYYFPHMEFGDAIIFNTFHTPHTAFQVINGTTENTRLSTDGRVMCLKNC